ncbi:hypothetical protein [Nodosilinea nodulosa]|uniref:hypothetical protein n=1 Tax=Nodosilinea nodulosa TaxID=416001 RepID=UPI0002D87FCC|nr:hypothetical protein [Nodosilinea nodulosa]
MPEELKRTRQCRGCPWRVDADPFDIPGYDLEKHKGLESTIAKADDLYGLDSNQLRVMICHELEDAYCLGWFMNQLGPGNNIALRKRARDITNINQVTLIGEQHECFEDTLPRTLYES